MSDEAPERRHSELFRLEREIQNGVKLDMLITQVGEIRQKQETDRAVLNALSEHKTIERVDTMWTSMGELRFLLRTFIGLVISVSVVIGILETTHKLLAWP